MLITARCLATVYAVLLLIATHLPQVRIPVAAGVALPLDKAIHFLAYAGLGFLVTLGVRRPADCPLRWRTLVLGGLALFAACDELTQPIFGRTMDLLDWLADVAGIFAGMALAGVGAYAVDAILRAIARRSDREAPKESASSLY